MSKVRKIRNRTIGYQPRQNVWREVKTVPALQLAGNWLANAGFSTGDQVQVIVGMNSITISKA